MLPSFRLPCVVAGALIAVPAFAQWVSDAAGAKIPDKPAAGQVHGTKFQPNKVTLSSTSAKAGEAKTTHFLTLRSGESIVNNTEYSITLMTKAGERLDGKSFTLNAQGKSTPEAVKDGAATYPAVQGVMMHWAQPGKSFSGHELGTKSTMRLEFGKASGGKMPGKIYIASQDPKKSYLAGKFTATVETLRDGGTIKMPSFPKKR